MRRLLIVTASLAGLGTAAAAQAAPVEIDLSGLRAGGRLYVQLQTREQFMGSARAAGQVVNAPAAGSLAVALDVPPGEYAATVWHDDNNNGRFDVDPTNGMPLDGVAMPNLATLRAAPTFDQVKLTVPAEGMKLPMALHYSR
ncbi:MAG: hypothetical protein JWO81_3197 [Alphaproteobacteria bacterium]|nr:hypothetical protein [Alphaproteobacteria bacterium]